MKWHLVLQSVDARACVVLPDGLADYAAAHAAALAWALRPEYKDSHVIIAVTYGDILDRQARLQIALRRAKAFIEPRRAGALIGEIERLL